MDRNTGKFPTISTMQGALWVALGSKSTYELAPSHHFSERKVVVHLERDFRLDESAKDPPLKVTFLCPGLIRLPSPSSPPSSDGRILVAKRSIPTPTPNSRQQHVEASVSELMFIASHQILLELRAASVSLSSLRDWDMCLEFSDSSLPPRNVRHISKPPFSTPHR